MKLIKGIFRFFKNLGKYLHLERAVIHDLQRKYREYQISQKPEHLVILINLVDFCNRIGINGETEAIKNEIIDIWKIHINKKQ